MANIQACYGCMKAQDKCSCASRPSPDSRFEKPQVAIIIPKGWGK